MLKCVTKIEGI
jgi:hypothetical protein